MGTGALLRAHRLENEEFDRQWGPVMDVGNNLPDEVMKPFIIQALHSHQGHILFNGYPRSYAQVVFLLLQLNELGFEISTAFLKHLTFEICWPRVRDSKKRGPRPDDNRKIFKKRWKEYHENAPQIDSYLRRRTTYLETDGRLDPADIHRAILTFLNARHMVACV